MQDAKKTLGSAQQTANVNVLRINLDYQTMTAEADKLQNMYCISTLYYDLSAIHITQGENVKLMSYLNST